MAFRRIATCLLIVLTASCVTVNKSILSSARMTSPVAKEQVHVYLADDSIPVHERIALLHAKGDESLTDESDMIDKFRSEAGKLGANAIVLNQVKDPGTAERVAAAIFGTSAQRRGQALAIFIPSLVK